MSDTRWDGYVNMLNKYGTVKDSSSAYSFIGDWQIDDNILTEQYLSNGLFARIIDAPAEEAIKHGFSLSIEDKSICDYIQDELDGMGYEDKFSTALKWARLYAGAIIVMLIDDGGRLQDSLNYRAVKSIDDMYVYERAVVTPNYSTESEYGLSKPVSYTVSSVAGCFTVHSSRCLVFRNGHVPENCPNINYRYFGIPEYVRIKTALKDAVISHSYATKMMERSVQPVHKIKDLASLLSTEDGEDNVIRRLNVIDEARGLFNSIAIDADGEDYAFQTFSFSGVSEIIDATCNMLSAITCIPQSVLFGRAPAGMDATGHSDFENYYNSIEHIQKQNIKENLRTVIKLIIREGQLKGDITKDIGNFKIKFNPLWNLSEEQQSQIETQKSAVASQKAATAQTYVDMGVLDPTEVRETLKASGIFVTDDSLDDELEEQLDLQEQESDMTLMADLPFQKDNFPLTYEENSDTITSVPIEDNEDEGNRNSGNYGHKGRKGQIGGSQKESAVINQAKAQCKQLVGMKTSIGITIKSVDPHFVKRMVERNVYFKSVVEALMRGKPMSGNKPDRKFLVYRGTKVLIDTKGGHICTVIYDNEADKAKGGSKNAGRKNKRTP